MKFNFIKNSKKFFVFSGILMVAVIIASFVIGVEFDIQFKGGAIVTYAYDGEIISQQSLIEDTIKTVSNDNTSLQFGDDLATGANTLVVSLPGSLTSDEMIALTDNLTEAFPENNIVELQSSNVDATIGKEFLLKCIIALLLAAILMVLYTAMRFRKIGGFSAGIMAMVALVHDIMIVYGVFVVFRIPINDNFIAVVLTILGFSLNDTIVIYDRIRENKKLMGSKVPLEELVNTSIQQSFTRAIITSLCSVLAMIVVTIVALLYNVNSILSFSLPMMIGLISGCYSSVYLVGPLWTKWRTRKSPTKTKK